MRLMNFGTQVWPNEWGKVMIHFQEALRLDVAVPDHILYGRIIMRCYEAFFINTFT